MTIDWKRKLCSRKLWAAVMAAVFALMTALFGETAQKLRLFFIRPPFSVRQIVPCGVVFVEGKAVQHKIRNDQHRRGNHVHTGADIVNHGISHPLPKLDDQAEQGVDQHKVDEQHKEFVCVFSVFPVGIVVLHPELLLCNLSVSRLQNSCKGERVAF